VLIDNFESYPVGSAIDGQGYWRAEVGSNATGAGVAADPLAASNRVLAIGPGGFTSGTLGARETFNGNPQLQVDKGSTATLFYQLAWQAGQDVDFSIGMTEVANPIDETLFNPFTQFRTQMALPFSSGYDHLSVRNGSSLPQLTDNVTPLTWYNVWTVINHASDSYRVYIQGGAFATQTLMAAGSATDFVFRNGATNADLITLFIATGRHTDAVPPNPKENVGPVYIDNVYIDTSGPSLVNPVPEPATSLLAAIGAMMAPGAFRMKARDRWAYSRSVARQMRK
jgi:hypothetical protein